MRTNPILASVLAAGMLAGSASVALSQGTTTAPGGVAGAGATSSQQQNDDDGFDLGWLGLLGLIGLAGLRGRKHDTHVGTTTRPHV